jgi:hypothetical protein
VCQRHERGSSQAFAVLCQARIKRSKAVVAPFGGKNSRPDVHCGVLLCCADDCWKNPSEKPRSGSAGKVMPEHG